MTFFFIVQAVGTVRPKGVFPIPIQSVDRYAIILTYFHGKTG